MTESLGQGSLLARIAAGSVDRRTAEALLARVCSSPDDLSPGVRNAFIAAAQAVGDGGVLRERIALHYLGSLSFDEADRYYETLIEEYAEQAVDMLRRKGGLFGVVNADVATTAYRRLLELRPDDDRGLLDFAALLGSRGFWAEAADACRAVVARSSDLGSIQEATTQLQSAVLLLRLAPLSGWAHATATRLLPLVTKRLPWLAATVERDGPLGWDFHATVAVVYWVLDDIRKGKMHLPSQMTGAGVEIARALACVPPNRSAGLPRDVTAERARAFDQRWEEAAASALGDFVAFLEPRPMETITGTARWVFAGIGAGVVEWDDQWLVGDAITVLARKYLEPSE